MWAVKNGAYRGVSNHQPTVKWLSARVVEQ
jgi:hypothetical protein